MRPTQPGQPPPAQPPQPMPRAQQPAPQAAADPRHAPKVRWVALPPPGTMPRRPARRPVPYTGPPAYPATPRWGLPNLTWRRPTAVPGLPSGTPPPMQRVRSLARNAVTVLYFVAALAGISAGAELWRYILLVQSRDSALSAAVVGASDALVIAGALLTFLFGILAIGLALSWFLAARAAAAAAGDQEPARPGWQAALGILLPGLNLVLAGSLVAELEHVVLRRPVAQRPRPSRLVLSWWGVWIANAVLVVLTVLWRMRDGVQAMADGVLLNVFVDLSAAGLAGLSAVLVYRLTELLAPIPVERLRPMRVLKVTGAPRPQLRPTRQPDSPR